MTRTRIGFIGAGIIANRHLGNLLGFDDVAVVAIADLLPERAGPAAARCDGKAYSDYREMLDREELDALYICVPPFAHGAPELAAVDHGLPFFVEKPLAADWETAETVGRGVAARQLITGVGYHWRYLDITERAQELLRANPARLATGYWLDFTPPPAWWISEAHTGGQMVEQTTHIFDLARLLMGEVTRLYAACSRFERPAFPQADIGNVSTVTLHFASGAVGSISSTCLLHWTHRIGLHLFCEGLAIEMTEFELTVAGQWERTLRKAQGDPFVREDRDFIDAVQGKPSRIRVPYHQALATHRLATAAAQSAREDRTVELQPAAAST
jgi:predicted dehydrogenase